MRVVLRSCFAPTLAILALGAPAAAWAQAPQTLQNCAQGVSGELPIGTASDPGYAWKQDIVTWLAQFQDVDFEWVEAVKFVPPANAYNAGEAPLGTLCSFSANPGPGQVLPAPWPGVGLAEQLQIEQFWLLVSSFSVPWSWFNHTPSIYTLDGMIDESTCMARTPGLAWGDSLAFFASWEYPGSPFRPGTANNDVLKRRLAAWLGLQLIMLDFAHHGATGNFTPTLAGQYQHPNFNAPVWNDMNNGAELSAQLGLMAWTFGHVRDAFDSTTELAIEEALLTYAERVHLWNPYHSQNNRGIRSTYGLYYVWEQTQDPSAQQWYHAALKQYLHPSGNNWNPAGHWSDDYGLDMGYGGACLIAANRVLSEDGNIPSWAHDAVDTSQELIAHMALPDHNGRWVAPNPFNSRTSMGSIRGVAPNVREGYYGGVERYLMGYDQGLPYAAATLRDVPVLGPQGIDALDPRAPAFHENLACFGSGRTQYLNPALTASPAWMTTNQHGQSDWPSLTRSQDFGPPPTFIENHRLGMLEDLWDQLDAQPQDALMPVELPGTKIRNFSNSFVYGRFDGPGAGREYAAMLHLGPVGQLPSGGESGFGGGQLAYFWTPDGGPTLFGHRKGRSTGDPQYDDVWSQWRSFPLHSVFLRTTANNLSTSSRIITPSAQVFPLAQAPAPADIPAALAGTGSWLAPPTVPDPQAGALLARVSGQIPSEGHKELDGSLITALLAPIDYQRSFLMLEDGVWVESVLGKSHPNERINEAWEMFPIYNRDTASQASLANTAIWLHSASQGLINATNGTQAPVSDVTMVDIRRDNGSTRITFDRKRLVQVSALWELGTQQSRTLMVDRLPLGCALTPGGCRVGPDSFRYLIQEL